MKQHFKLWLLLVAIFVFVLSATLVSCEKEQLAPPASTAEEQLPPFLIELRCCDDPTLTDLDGDGDIDEDDARLKGKDTKNDKTESE